ncbi:MAG: DUF2971 domain-containing protein [Firmicutes bacterium]|jgi:hypothetical protein|nr:DUF2971 domain-containing protein [Bacillota bacterium]
MIFHYTDDDNFVRILKNGELYLTRSTSSNDLMDTVYISKLLMDNAEDIFGDIISNKIIQKDKFNEKIFSRLVVDIFRKFMNDIISNNSNEERTNKCFVICFTDKPDSRFLWEAYAKDMGVSIGVEKEDLEKYIHDKHAYISKNLIDMKFSKVIYDEKEQLNKLRKLSKKIFNKHYKDIEELSSASKIVTFDWISEFDGEITKVNSQTKQITIRQWVVDFMEEYNIELLKLAPFIKHPYWKEEREYRLCVYRPLRSEVLNDLCYYKRKDTGKKVHYMSVPFEKSLIKK